MKFRPLRVLLFPLLLWQCTTTPPPLPPVKPSPPPVAGPDDDHRLVSREEFHASPWSALPAARSWKALPDGVAIALADGREVRFTFVSPSLARWWVPAAPGDQPLSPGAQYTGEAPLVKVTEAQGVLTLSTVGLGARIVWADLSWTLVRGDKTAVRTAGGPRVSGRRLLQAFRAEDAALWTGPGLTDQRSTKAWIDEPREDGSGPFAFPVLEGAGGSLPFVVALDNPYQAFARVTEDEASLGALSGGLDLLIACAPQPGAAVEALTAILGRGEVPPLWSHGTALLLPEGEKGTFVRKAKLSVQTAVGAAREDRQRFASVAVLADTDHTWLARPALDGAVKSGGLVLEPRAERHDWNTQWAGRGPLAAVNNQLPGLEARAVAEAWNTSHPGLRPLVLAGSAGWGTTRWAQLLVTVTPEDKSALARVLSLGAAGLGTPAVRLDVSGLARPESRAAAFQALVSWLLVPTLILDAGPDPAAVWASLSDAEQRRLKTLLDRRSQFKPLFDQWARQSATGRPAWAPLWFAGGNDPQALKVQDEVLLGDGLLLAPAQGPRSVYLPGPGVWFDFWTGEEFGGGKAYDLEARPDRPLLFARGGAFVPQREPEAFDDKDVYNPLTIHVFPGGRGAGTYSLDDGVTLGWKNGEAWETRLSFDFSQKEMTLDHELVSSTGRFRADPYLLYRLHNVFRPKQVKIDGKPIPLFGDSWGITDTDRSAAWYEGDHTLLIKTFKPEKDQTLQISF